MSIEIVRSVQDEAWDGFVERNPLSNIFHTRHFVESFRDLEKYVPYCFFLEDDKAIKACLIAIQTKVLGSFLENVASRSVVYGGILYEEGMSDRYIQKHMGKLIQAYDEALRKKALYTEIRNVDDATRLILPLADQGHKFVPHVNYLVDLSQGDEHLWSSFSHRFRRVIRGAMKESIEIVDVSDEGQLETFAELVRQTYAKIHVPCFDLEVFRNVWRSLYPMRRIRITLAEYRGDFIAARADLIYRGRVFDWFAASSSEGDALNANSLLAWEMMQWGCSNGHETFDFGGAGDPNKKYNVREFKRRFAGRLVNFGRFEKVYSPVLYSLGHVSYNALRRIIF
jgi:hypothetical protein